MPLLQQPSFDFYFICVQYTFFSPLLLKNCWAPGDGGGGGGGRAADVGTL